MAVQFTFNEILASSAVYKRAEAYALAASIDTDAESSPGVSPLYHDNVALAVRKASPFKDFRVPPRNQGFKGQEDILKALHDSLERKEHVPKVRTCVLWGFGGVGKSEIVREYAYRQREQCSYDVVWWVRAESRTSIAISYSSFSETLGLTTSTNPSDQVRLVKKWLASTESSWLLVFDDFDDEITQLESLLPGATEGYGSVILTTRRRFNWPGIPSIEVAPLTMDEGASFLLGILAETSIISNETMAAVTGQAHLAGGSAAKPEFFSTAPSS
ncbi:P-loop containing nucleoside triphosphate hydrolase protein [Ilyonectria destructans]|nr:P-loop containing nucleoside triphosphate hydrolase protein [Ilyonectria destructans]